MINVILLDQSTTIGCAFEISMKYLSPEKKYPRNAESLSHYNLSAAFIVKSSKELEVKSASMVSFNHIVQIIRQETKKNTLKIQLLDV